jgi:hypothetical protein
VCPLTVSSSTSPVPVRPLIVPPMVYAPPAPLLLELPLELELLELELELLELELLELEPLELELLELELLELELPELELLELELELLELELLEVSGPLTVPPPQPTIKTLAHTPRASARTAARLRGRESITSISPGPGLHGKAPLTPGYYIDGTPPWWPRSRFASGRATIYVIGIGRSGGAVQPLAERGLQRRHLGL